MMKTRIATILLISLTAFTFLLSCNLDGEGAFYSIATAKEITTGSGYAQIEKVLRYDGTTAYVQAGKRISYKNATDEDFTDVDLPDEISSVEEVVFDGTNYYILSLDVDNSVHELYEVPANASTADQILSGMEILMLLESDDTAYAIYDDDGDLKLEDLTNSNPIDIDDTDLSGDLTSAGSFMVHDGITDTTHLFLSTDEDKLFHSTDFINFTDISSSSIKPVGGIALGADVYVYGYTQTSETFGVYALNAASTFDTAVATLSTETPKLSEAGLPTVVVDDTASSEVILIYVADDNLVEFKPTDETLAFASGYGLADVSILSFYRIDNDEFLTTTASGGGGLLYTLSKDTDGF
jgi:hypothetical protein